jgi:20S proteasome subunit beta 2
MLKQHLFKHQGHVSAALVLGGVDVSGPGLYSIYPHGSTDKLPYVTMGSGSLAAMAVFEDGYRENMELDEAKKLVRDAVAAGVFNDLGSGSNIDLCVITADGVQYLRPYEIANVRAPRQNVYSYKKGTTAVLTESIESLGVKVDVVDTPAAMDIST